MKFEYPLSHPLPPLQPQSFVPAFPLPSIKRRLRHALPWHQPFCQFILALLRSGIRCSRRRRGILGLTRFSFPFGDLVVHVLDVFGTESDGCGIARNHGFQ